MIKDNTCILTINTLKKKLGLPFCDFVAERKKNSEKWKIKLKNEDDDYVKLKEFLKNNELNEENISQLRKCVCIQWILGFPLGMRSLYMRNNTDIVSIDNKIDYRKIDIPDGIIKKFFNNSWEFFVENVKITFKKISKDLYEFMRKIIIKTSPEQIWWLNNIVSRYEDCLK